MIFRTAILMTLTLLAACAPVTQTDTASFTDPAWRGRSFSALLIQVDKSSLQEQQAIESAASQKLKLAGIDASAGSEFFPPTRNYNPSARKHILRQTNAEGVVVVTPTEKHTVQRYIPPSYNAGLSYPITRADGRVGYVHQPGFYDPGFVLTEPRASYDVALYSLPNYTKVWTAEFRVAGTNGMSFTTVGEHFGAELVKRLAQDGLISPQKNTH